ncbi:hypothetical protein BPUTEOMOX_568 [methanotrophic endosymbiont of Bathymodiolus puteoserpentis (Logatchev)]|nr:hypothetical protein BPUTEOMOX_568 [methanotrophic endosymbiont of Bathymodiolus puteoserpentis (Logatchev)]
MFFSEQVTYMKACVMPVGRTLVRSKLHDAVAMQWKVDW